MSIKDMSTLNRTFAAACHNGYLSHVVKNLRLGGDMYYKNCLPIRLACEAGNIKVLEYLVLRGLDLKRVPNDVLLAAALYEHIDVIEYLVAKSDGALVITDDIIDKVLDNGIPAMAEWLLIHK